MQPLKDYSFIRGVCHNPKHNGNQETLERELSFCRRLNLNSIRFWMSQEAYERDSDGYLQFIGNFIRTCGQYEITCMPILWNGNFITEFQTPSDEEYKQAAAYAEAVINAFKGEENLLMWDIMNEPMCNDFLHKAPGEEYNDRFQLIANHVRKLCEIVRDLDPDTAITVGHEQVEHCETTADLVNVISYHDYLSTRAAIEGAILQAKELGLKWNKPILNTETGCLGRANPYEIELELAEKHKIGWYLFNLIIEGFWGDIHGLVYPDGTIRDPGVIAALFGFYRKRSSDRIKVNANKEGHAYRAVRAVEDSLRVEPTTLFMSKQKTTDDILTAAEYCVNLLEAAQMVPMWDPPSVQIEYWRSLPEEERDIWEIRRFAYEMAELVRKNCMF